MAGNAVTITVMAPGVLQHRLEGVRRGLGDFRPVWPRLRPLFSGWMREQFETEGGWGGARWAGLSPSYAAWKARRYPGRGILVATGALRRSALAPEWRGTASEVEFRITNPVAKYHQYGTSKMVARPIIPASLPRSAHDEVRDLMDDYVRETLRRWQVAA